MNRFVMKKKFMIKNTLIYKHNIYRFVMKKKF